MQGDCAARKAMSFPRVMRLRNRTWPAASAPCAWNTCFAMSNPIVVTCAMDASFSDGSTPSPWHADAVRGRPPHHPITDYLVGLKWDRTPRLDTWAIKHLSAEDTPFVRAVAARFL